MWITAIGWSWSMLAAVGVFWHHLSLTDALLLNILSVLWFILGEVRK